jgi:hypothetical protein
MRPASAVIHKVIEGFAARHRCRSECRTESLHPKVIAQPEAPVRDSLTLFIPVPATNYGIDLRLPARPDNSISIGARQYR